MLSFFHLFELNFLDIAHRSKFLSFMSENIKIHIMQDFDVIKAVQFCLLSLFLHWSMVSEVYQLSCVASQRLCFNTWVIDLICRSNIDLPRSFKLT